MFLWFSLAVDRSGGRTVEVERDDERGWRFGVGWRVADGGFTIVCDL